jgi:hypothetical protein
MSGNSIRHAHVQRPIHCQLEIILDPEGHLADLNYRLYDALPGTGELELMRAVVFVRETIRRAEGKGLLIEDVILRLKSVDIFAIEYAVAKAVAESQADFWQLGTIRILRAGRAA